MIFANTPCTIKTATGYDQFGKPTLGSPAGAKCAVVKLSTSNKKTSIRTDRSASQGNADEIIADARLLFEVKGVPSVGDVVTIRGIALTVDSVEQKFNTITETLDHYQVDLSIWA